MIQIRKDSSNETYEYKFINNGREVMMGDGYTKEEIIEFVKELMDSLVSKSEARFFIEVDDEGEDRSFIYQNKIKGTDAGKNTTTYNFESNIGEIKPGVGFPKPTYQTEGWGSSRNKNTK